MYPSFFAISPDVYLNLWNLYEAQINSLIFVSKPTLLTSKIKFSSKIFGAYYHRHLDIGVNNERKFYA